MVDKKGSGDSTSCTSIIPNDSHSGINNISSFSMEEEMKQPYVKNLTEVKDDVVSEDIKCGIKYLSTLTGGLSQNRILKKLIKAIEHIEILKRNSRFDDKTGLFREYTLKDLRIILKDFDDWYPEEDIERVFRKFITIYGFPPSHEEFIDQHEKMKGIAHLEETLEKYRDKWQKRIKDLEEKNESLKESSMLSKCKVCFDKEVQILFNSCNHIVSCTSCAKNLTKCPVCRAVIQKTTKVVLA